ncbi:unnamed protein product [Caenorhabditis auriculariae]|uniref:Uncharacterized protein n=1 Tax=Caenorhabditis auriculariae TaxID=2777116 RepID=A0A8S1GS56_9PELO|nr:unnamed protein product [Caenorhabditis auriculariae]
MFKEKRPEAIFVGKQEHAKPAGSSSKEAEKQKEASKATEPVKPAGPSFHRALAAVEAIADQKRWTYAKRTRTHTKRDVSKACTLTAAEQDQHENTILHFCEQTAIADLEETVTEKLHILSKHVTPFVRRFGTWCKMSEQAIAAAHAVSKEKKKGNNKLAPSLMCELALRGKMLIGY